MNLKITSTLLLCRCTVITFCKLEKNITNYNFNSTYIKMHVKLYLDENINGCKTCKLCKHYKYIGAPIICTTSSRTCLSYAYTFVQYSLTFCQ